MNESERYEQYLICKQRGHTRGEKVIIGHPYGIRERDLCKDCETIFWSEFKELNAPKKPEEQ